MVASCAACRFNVQPLTFRVGVQWYLDVRVVGWSVSEVCCGRGMGRVVASCIRVSVQRLVVDTSTISRNSPTKSRCIFPIFLTHSLFSMASFACPQCDRRCKNLSGLKRHQNSMHGDHPGLYIPVTELQRDYHPNLNGTYNIFIITLLTFSTGRRCDRNGAFVPPDAPPELPATKANDDWSPFTSRAGFELADFLFADAQLSQKKINHLLELWAATLVPHNDFAPIANNLDLHQQIDVINLGDARWEHADLKYEDPLPRAIRHPEWKTTVYDVWYRNPCRVIENILANPEFDGHIDYAAYREFNGEKRQYGNMMSGNWAWRQSVRIMRSAFPLDY
jgi:hypothetical protein